MRIAVLNWTCRKAGGAETYLNTIISEIAHSGHSVALMYEVDEPVTREQVAIPQDAPAWCVSEIGVDRALSELRGWNPDLIYVHGLESPQLEAEVIKIAPAAFFAHGYYGTCISGAKTFKNPNIMPCSRIFGWECLLQFYPRRCGGLSPLTMWSEYRRQSARFNNLQAYAVIITGSQHMANEYLRHGFAPSRVHKLLLPIQFSNTTNADPVDRNGNEWRLLFLGRMDHLKGGGIFLDALPQVNLSVNRKLKVTFAGDGPDREEWQRKAATIESQNRGLEIEFTGWQDNRQRDLLLVNTDLLVMPSLWPEPLGLSGLEAGLYGIPVAAFAVGGIPEWLSDGENGCLAPGNPPTAGNLTSAILRCLRDSDTYSKMSRKATEQAQRFSLKNHLDELLGLFEDLVSGNRKRSAESIA